jgi:hypothetical protein
MKNLPSIDQLIELASKHPEELERVRQRHVDALIQSAPEHIQRRLRGLLFQIDCKRQLHHNSPMGSCMAITRMMMDSLQSLNEALHGYAQQDTSYKRKNGANHNSIIPFPAIAN